MISEETTWTSHLGLQAMIMPAPDVGSVNYSRCVSLILNQQTRQQVWIKIPLETHLSYKSLLHDRGTTDGWEIWRHLQTSCNYSQRLGVALVLTKNLMKENSHILDKWVAEPIKAIVLNTRLFVANKQGFPVLTQAYQSCLSKLMSSSKIHIVIQGRPKLTDTLLPYVQYIRFLERKFRDGQELSFGDKFTEDYKDQLQAPLQPLMDNLESQTYDVFEKDPVKYRLYQDAIEKALHEVHSQRMASDELITVAVLGAGRGPLVDASRKASAVTGVDIRIVAIEKNKNAIITLKNRIRNESWTNVYLFSTDMRKWEPSTDDLADIIVSELLGSWGDNELSPECLDGAQKCLKPGGISIPKDYTSFLSPISSFKMWNAARNIPKGLNTPFVVKMDKYHVLDEPKPVFRFEHPKLDKSDDNTRFGIITFRMSESALVHGFSGTFESTLFGDTNLSIVPSSHSPGMFSWFPIFLPLSNPISVNVDDELIISIWRCVDSTKVWYEWCILSPMQTPIQNANGSSYWIGL